jgi:predicted ATP-grasp superfamily ATP-dependent carboligase
MTPSSSEVERATGSLRVDVPVVVLNTFHSGLAIARDLGRLGVRVIGLTAHKEAYGNVSRWIEYRNSPDSLTQPRELLACLFELSEELNQRPILLPTRDHDINFLINSWESLQGSYILPMLPPDRMGRVLNKDVVATAARESGISVPNSVTVTRAEELASARRLQFPCICKPVYATQWRKPGIWDAVGRQKVRRVESFEELEEFYASFSHLDPLVSVQEWVEGGETNLQIFGSYCSADHEVRAFFMARKRLQSPRLAGTGIAVEAVPIPDLEEPSRRLLRRLQFRGISEIEFKRDERDGRLYLIEINPRHWDQHGLGTSVGVNLSEALYRDATEQPARAMRQSSARKTWIGDIELFRYVVDVIRGRAPARDVSQLFEANMVPSIFEWSDLRPFLAVLGLLTTKRWGNRV